MEDSIKKIFLEKQFFELSEKERKLIHQWATNEEEFDAMRQVVIGSQMMSSERDIELSDSIKTRLDNKFDEKFSQAKIPFIERLWTKLWIPGVPLFKKPMIQLAMILVVAVFSIPFMMQNRPPQYAMHETDLKLEKDTVDKPTKRIERNAPRVESIVVDDKREQHIAQDEPSLNKDLTLSQKSEQNDVEMETGFEETQMEKVGYLKADQRLEERSVLYGEGNVNRKKVSTPENKGLDKTDLQKEKLITASETLGLLTSLY